MRFVLCALLVASVGCGGGGDDGYSYYPPGDGPDGCHVDTDCSGSDICARDGECLAASEVRHISVTWTVGGAAASDATCADQPDLEVSFDEDGGQGFGFAPVPCNEGKFTVDRLPDIYDDAGISDEAESYFLSGGFDANGDVGFDLPPE